MAEVDAPADRQPALHGVRTDEYCYHLPTPPRILLPPLGVEWLEGPPHRKNERVHAGAAVSPTGSRYPFLANYTLEPCLSTPKWSYESRRRAQPVLPFLYLGPMAAASDRTFLAAEGITLLLGIRQSRAKVAASQTSSSRIADDLAIERTLIDVTTTDELMASFRLTCDTINQHLLLRCATAAGTPSDESSAGKVMVYCESGNERSAAVVAAYVIRMFPDTDHIEAMQICQARRFCVNFNDTVKNMLKTYSELVSAERDVLDFPDTQRRSISTPFDRATSPFKCSKGKRKADDMDTDDCMSEPDVSATLPSLDRRGATPFLIDAID